MKLNGRETMNRSLVIIRVKKFAQAPKLKLFVIVIL